MKTAQEGFSPIITIILVVVAILVLLFLLNVGKLFFTGTPITTSNQPKQGTDFEKIENETYTFYYPKGYVKGELSQSETGEKDILDYKNPSSKATDPEEMLLRMSKANRKLPIPTFDQCQKLGEAFRQKADDQITAEVARGGLGDGKGVGCKVVVKYQVPGVNDKSDFIEKQLWDPQAEQATIYKVRALYFENASSSQAKILESSVDQFTLK